MDPDAALDTLIQAVLNDEWATAEEALAALQQWSAKRGRKPEDPRRF